MKPEIYPAWPAGWFKNDVVAKPAAKQHHGFMAPRSVARMLAPADIVSSRSIWNNPAGCKVVKWTFSVRNEHIPATRILKYFAGNTQSCNYYIRFIQPNMDSLYIIVSQELHKDSIIALHLSIFIKVKDLLISVDMKMFRRPTLKSSLWNKLCFLLYLWSYNRQINQSAARINQRTIRDNARD